MRLFHIVGNLYVPENDQERSVDCPQRDNLQNTARVMSGQAAQTAQRESSEMSFCYSSCSQIDCPFYKANEQN